MRFKPMTPEFAGSVKVEFVEYGGSDAVRLVFTHAQLEGIKFIRETNQHVIHTAKSIGGVPPALFEMAAMALWVQMPEAHEESFDEAPISINEHKAGKAWNAALWTPRDALIDLLRKIDKGEYPRCDALILAWRSPGERPEKGVATFHSISSPDIHVTLGLMNRLNKMIDTNIEVERLD